MLLKKMEKKSLTLPFLCENTLTGYTLGAHCNFLTQLWANSRSSMQQSATIRDIYVVCIYGATCRQIFYIYKISHYLSLNLEVFSGNLSTTQIIITVILLFAITVEGGPRK